MVERKLPKLDVGGSNPLARSGNEKNIVSFGYSFFFLVVQEPFIDQRDITSYTPKGIYHRIEKGETMWRIAKTYGVDVEEIKSYNNIRDVEDLKVGTVIFIPGAKERIPVYSSW